MNNLSLFLGGAAVTLVVGGAIAALIWGAILDGRTVRAMRVLPRREPSPQTGANESRPEFPTGLQDEAA
jgi:hypothetical protein